MTDHDFCFPEDLKSFNIHMIGIKGTGMTALAEILIKRGATITGSDVPETFYTDRILQNIGVSVQQGFSESNVPKQCMLGIRSAAWNDTHPEVKELLNRNIPVISYPEALGALSLKPYACAIAGVHGKTSTTAMTGSILKRTLLPFTVITGSGVSNFGGFSTFRAGDSYLVAETCEYRRHFLSYHPDMVLLTSVEKDHLDYFTGLEDIENAFSEFISRLPENGIFIFCSDDSGARKVTESIHRKRPDIRIIPYGETPARDLSNDNRFNIVSIQYGNGSSRFSLSGFDQEFVLKIPGKHMVLNAAGALAASILMIERDGITPISEITEQMANGLQDFLGTKRRSEIIGQTPDDILVMDDYGHHPTAIRKTLDGLREFYPGRRIIIDFMSHTYSRTRSLLEDFATAFGSADIVILNRIYPSAREQSEPDDLNQELFHLACRNHQRVLYFHEPEDALPYLLEELKPKDLFITMGAGSNWILGEKFLSIKVSDKHI